MESPGRPPEPAPGREVPEPRPVPAELQSLFDRSAEARAWKQDLEARVEALGARDRQRQRWFDTVDARLRLLDRERQKFRALVTQSDASVLVLGTDQCVRWANQEAVRKFSAGGGSAALAGRRCDVVCAAQGRACAECPVGAVLEGRIVAHAEWRRETDGEMRNLYVTALPIHGPEGNVEEVLLTLQDLSDLTVLRRMERDLAEADRLASLGTMSAGIAHEFKNRLAPLRGMVQLLSQGGVEPSRVTRYAPLMIEELDRLAGLVRDVLDAARPQAARRRQHDLVELVRQLTSDFERECGAEIADRDLLVTFTFEGTGPAPVLVDGDQLRAVFQNVMKNALEASGRGGRITVGCALGEGRARTSVRDTGCGMEASVLARIHEPFFTTKGVRGTGLGMCIVKSLVEANGGELTVRSQPGRGTEVELSFELHAAGEPGAAPGERAA
jgi:signal transduction histidine kinase